VSPYLAGKTAPKDYTLVEENLSALRRREDKKRRQRQAAIALRSGQYLHSSDSGFSSNLCRSRPTRSNPSLPVLSPTTFLLDSFDAAEWIVVRRRRNKLKRLYRGQRRSSALFRSPMQMSSMIFSKCVPLTLGQSGQQNMLTHMKGCMGLESTIEGLLTRRAPQFDRGVRRRLGLGRANW
jgi:hypothetical protein